MKATSAFRAALLGLFLSAWLYPTGIRAAVSDTYRALIRDRIAAGATCGEVAEEIVATDPAWDCDLSPKQAAITTVVGCTLQLDAACVPVGDDADGDGYTLGAGDCDDGDPRVYPGAPELCDGVRNDCADGAWSDDGGRATFYAATGGPPLDRTSILGAGVPGSPAIVALSKPGILNICTGTWYASLEMLANVTVSGVGSGVVVSGGGAASPVRVLRPGAKVTISDLTLAHGEATTDIGDAWLGGGAAVCDVAARLALTRVTVESSHAALGGGVFAGSGCEVVVDGGEIRRTSASYGGAAFVDGGSLVMTGTTLRATTASEDGGGILLADGTADIADTAFVGASTPGWGGGLLLLGATTANLSRVTFEGLAADWGAGVALFDGPSVDLEDVRFIGNQAAGYGGAILAWGATVSGCPSGDAGCFLAFEGNGAVADGGAVVLRDSEGTLSGASFRGDLAEDEGAGVVLAASMLELRSCRFEGETASVRGGAILLDAASRLDVTASDFEGNSPDDTWHDAAGAYWWGREASFVCDFGGCLSAMDADGDGVSPSAGDCDDADPEVHPGAVETCNGVDDDCTGGEQGAVDAVTVWADADADGSGDPLAEGTGCPGPGLAVAGGDCDDSDPQVHPGAPETCDGRDEDCDGAVDAADGDVVGASEEYADGDGDGYGAGPATRVCAAQEGWVADGTDCDDTRPEAWPGAEELPNGLDDDCDGIADDVDADGDGWSVSDGDTDDGNAWVHPGATELCDGIRNDSDAAGWSSDAGLATLFGDDGTVADLSATLGDGNAADLAHLEVAEPGTLHLCDGTWYAALTVWADLEIRGITGGGDVTLSAADYESVVTVAGVGVDLAVEDLTLDDGEAHGEVAPGVTGGGGVSCALPGSVSLVRVTVRSSEADLGGGVYVGGGCSLVASDTRFVSNRAWDDGAAIFVADASASVSGGEMAKGRAVRGGAAAVVGGTLWLSGVEVAENRATGNGGGVYGEEAAVTIQGGSLVGNDAGWDGGGVAVSGGTLALADASLAWNVASGHGGGIAATAGTLTLTGISVSGNLAGGDGGGVHAEGTGVLGNGGEVVDNAADGDGGGLDLVDGEATFDGTRFEGNSTPGDGGGIRVSGGRVDLSAGDLARGEAGRGAGLAAAAAEITLSGMAVVGNVAGVDGGGLHLADSTTLLADVDFSGNSAATGNGGGVAGDGGVLTAEGGSFASESAAAYGGAIAAVSTEIALTGVAFDGPAAADGGAISLRDDPLDGFVPRAGFVDCGVTSARANGAGGAVHASGVDVEWSGGWMDGGSAGDSGGGVFVIQAAVAFAGTRFQGNTAGVHGGAVAGDSADLSVADSTFTANEAGNGGGAIFTSHSTLATCEGDPVCAVPFQGNQAAVSGGAIAAADSTLALEGVTSTGDSAGVAGGGLYGQDSTVTAGEGGGIDFQDATAGSWGGAIYLDGGTATVTQGAFVDATAGSWGGAIYLTEGTATVTQGAFTRCASPSYGAVVLRDAAFTCQGCTQEDNSPADTWVVVPADQEDLPGYSWRSPESYLCASAGCWSLDDRDGDGFSPYAGDCDDANAVVSPARAEACDQVDNDCDGIVDEDQDGDGDGVDPCDGDCDDALAAVWPGAPEVCDDRDDDCDGLVDDLDGDFTGTKHWYPDGDGDGSGDAGGLAYTCTPPAGFIADGTDCDDADPGRNQRDEDGDGQTTCAGDCDDHDGSRDTTDTDRDGQTSCAGDCDDHDVGRTTLEADGDGWTSCDGDSDDYWRWAYPGAVEICDGRQTNSSDASWTLAKEPAGAAAFFSADPDGHTYGGTHWNTINVPGKAGAPGIVPLWEPLNLDDPYVLGWQAIYFCRDTVYARLEIDPYWAEWYGDRTATRVEIVGAGPTAGRTTFDAEGLTGAVDIFGWDRLDRVVFRNLEITDGDALLGGGLACDGSDTEVLLEESVVVSGNSADSGGGIAVSGGCRLTAEGAVVEGNEATLQGGGVYTDGGSVTLTGTTLTANRAGTDGGAFAAPFGGLLDAFGAVFQANAAGSSSGWGGALFGDSVESVWALSGVAFLGNSAPAGGGCGGAVALASTADVDIVETWFQGNFSGDCGGGLYLEASGSAQAIWLTANTFEDNIAGGNGGGALLASVGDSSVEVDGSEFRRNTASSGDGGGLSATGGSAVRVLSSAFESNLAGRHGGAASAETVPLTLSDDLFLDNAAGTAGGAVGLLAGGSVEAQTCDFSGNTPDDVGSDLGLSYAAGWGADFTCDPAGCEVP